MTDVRTSTSARAAATARTRPPPGPTSALDRLAARAYALPHSAMYLVPLRLFVAIGWLRAGAEKLVDAGWWSGATLRSFVDAHVAEGLALRPFVGLLRGPVSDHAPALAASLAVAQIAVGVCLLLGWRTTVAIAVAATMNVAFLVAGSTNPNVFYLLMEWALLVGGAGAMLGLDGRRRPAGRLGVRWSSTTWTWVGASTLLVACLSAFFVTLATPSRAVEDPALVLVTLSLLGFGTAALAALRARLRQRTEWSSPPPE